MLLCGDIRHNQVKSVSMDYEIGNVKLEVDGESGL